MNKRELVKAIKEQITTGHETISEMNESYKDHSFAYKLGVWKSVIENIEELLSK